MSSLDRILPFLRPIEDLLVDPAITEVMVNAGGRRVFVERRGCIEHVADRSLEIRNLTVAIKNIARACGDEISERQPMLDARLEDGSRVAAMFPPCAVEGPTLTVRKFTHRYSLDDLVAVATLTVELADTLRAAVAARSNILISGGTGMWHGTATIQVNPGDPNPLAPMTGEMTWTFEVVPETNMQSLRATIHSTHPWLTIDTTGSTALSPGNSPPTQISTHGEFNSPRGCRGTFGSVGNAEATRIDADFTGTDSVRALGDGRAEILPAASPPPLHARRLRALFRKPCVVER